MKAVPVMMILFKKFFIGCSVGWKALYSSAVPFVMENVEFYQAVMMIHALIDNNGCSFFYFRVFRYKNSIITTLVYEKFPTYFYCRVSAQVFHL